MRIAILGAGGAGVCAALELAERGYHVDLYEENAEPLKGASGNNEGKVHLGLVYAKDQSLDTAKLMIRGAVHFAAYLNRWIDFQSIDALLSTPFYYAVHKETMTDPADLEAHYERCRELFDEACSTTGFAYMGRDRKLTVEKVPRDEMAELVSPDHFTALYRTSELAVDVRAVAGRLTAAVRANPRIRFIGGAKVSSVTAAEGAREQTLRVVWSADGAEHSEVYEQVANTLWHGRLEIDRTFGLAPERKWIYRYKVGGRINVPIERAAIPSVTFVLGPFGDFVNFGERGLYFSWYPVGMVGTSQEVRPPDWGQQISEAQMRRILRESYRAVQSMSPGLGSLKYVEEAVDAMGGVIFAWGATDIDHQTSRLHTRHEIGIHSVGNYHSVNTGKYTMVPYLGYQTAERILGIS